MIKELKSMHDSTPIPDKLGVKIDEAIESCMKLHSKSLNISTYKYINNNKKHKKVLIPLVCSLMIFMAFIITLNTSEAFAQSMKAIPVLDKICEIFTFRAYVEKDEYNIINVKLPKIANTHNSELENRLNYKIINIVQKEIDEAKKRAKEYYDAFISTGGRKEDFTPVNIIVDYDIKSINSEYTSFVVSKFESLASAYQMFCYYNIDFESGKELTLKDVLGSNYKKIVTDDVNSQIAEFKKSDEVFFFDDVAVNDLIDDKTNFYINDKGKIVVVFEKYSLAAGAYGRLEFVIHSDMIK